MFELGRELTRSEKAKIRRVVESNCANYDREYGCLPLETECYMNTIGYVGSSQCRYFREAILPASPELLAIFQRGETRNCKWCGQPFPEAGRRQYCSRHCADAAKRAASRERVRRFRDKENAR